MNQYIVQVLSDHSETAYVMANSPSHAVELAFESGQINVWELEEAKTVVVECQTGLLIKFEIAKK